MSVHTTRVLLFGESVKAWAGKVTTSWALLALTLASGGYSLEDCSFWA